MKTINERLQQAYRLMPHERIMAVIMAGLGMSKGDIMLQCGLSSDEYRTLTVGNHKTITAIRENPEETRAVVLQWQQDRAMISGFALSHNPSLPPRDLRQVASTAAILAKSAHTTAPAAKASTAKAPAAPARPA